MRLVLSHGAIGAAKLRLGDPLDSPDWFVVQPNATSLDSEVERLRRANRRIINLTDDLLDAQADLQWALGVHRLDAADSRGGQHGPMIQDYMERTLARLHTLLDNLGTPMYDAAVHPEVPAGPTNHKRSV